MPLSGLLSTGSTKPNKGEHMSKPGQIGIGIDVDGDIEPTIGIGSGLSMDMDGDLNIQIAPGISMDLTGD
jgi:hypothetical protein